MQTWLNVDEFAKLMGKSTKEIIKLCKKGPHSSNVTRIKTQDYKQEYPKKSFDILNSN